MAPIYFVVDDPEDWPEEIPGVSIVTAKGYLTDPKYGDAAHAKVFNLCASYRYQSIGYYVSLLAAARSQRPLPSVTAIQEMKSNTIIRFVSEELEETIQKSLAPIQSDKFTLSIYFGRNLARRYDSLCGKLFNQFEAPLLRAQFAKQEDGSWTLQSIRPIPAGEIPDDHWPSLLLFATEYFDRREHRLKKRQAPRYDLAILVNPGEDHPPSNQKAIKKFIKAAEAMDFGVELITKEDYSRLAEFDALFIRETTSVHHHTYRFAQRAAAEGLVVIDDPESILKCANKVFLAEAMACNDVATPKTMIVHEGNADSIGTEIGFPCVIKQPDSSFSEGVWKVKDQAELDAALERLFAKSDLLIVQEFARTDFDWRVGIFDRQVLFVCKYHMAEGHWQIRHVDDKGEVDYGRVESFAVEQAPEKVVKVALEAADLIGDGLYGVDLKQVGNRLILIEVNDNPNIDAGFEDEVLKDELYRRIMRVFLKRVEHRKEKR